MPSSRQCFSLIALGCGALMAIALYMQYGMGLAPCYLCIVQRVFVVVTGAIALLAALHNPGAAGIRAYGLLGALAAAGGSGFSIRQLWLQSLPEDQVPACGPPADFLMDRFSVGEWLPMLLQGDGNCAKVDWSFLGLSIAGWLLLCFALIILLNLWQVARPAKG
ncbi:MAG: disulfide bond formation protein B [Porticoccaceae bacterium]|jgi:disulfide bond formation protein DsbB|nr:disulfide bond formation protein B [Porticoccaceae bacterium]